MPKPITITDVEVILTQPGKSRLAIVKVITSESGLYGLGCATFTQRIFAVATAIERHLKPFLLGRDVDRIEEIWNMSMVHGYWRNGPVLNNAISESIKRYGISKASAPAWLSMTCSAENRARRPTSTCTPMATARRKSPTMSALTWSVAFASFACRWAATAEGQPDGQAQEFARRRLFRSA